MKRPSFQFYPADWQANGNLRRCTHEEKGIWIDVMCLLHDQERYGVIDWSLKEIAQAVGTTVAKLKGLVSKDVFKGADGNEECEALVYVPRSGRRNGEPVVLIEAQKGPIWYSSRMVRDEYVRQHAGASTRFKQSENTESKSPSHSPSHGQGEAPSHSPSQRRSDGSTSSSSSSSKNYYETTSPTSPSEPIGSDGKPSNGGGQKLTDPDEIIFGYGVPLLVQAGSTDKHARSFLGGLRKNHGDLALIDKLRECLRERPLQPLEWLAAALPPAGKTKGPKAENFAATDYGSGGRL